MSMLAAPLVEGVAADAAGTAAAGTAGAAAKGAASKGAGRVAPNAAKVKVPAKTAAARAAELKASGVTRAQATRTLADEYGATGAQAGDLLDAAPAAPATPDPAPEPAPASSGMSLPNAPKAVTSAVNAGGGAILGTIAYVLFLTYMRGGLAGVKALARAKFLNQVSTSSTKATASGGPLTQLPGTDVYGQGTFVRQPGSPA